MKNKKEKIGKNLSKKRYGKMGSVLN